MVVRKFKVSPKTTIRAAYDRYNEPTQDELRYMSDAELTAKYPHLYTRDRGRLMDDLNVVGQSFIKDLKHILNGTVDISSVSDEDLAYLVDTLADAQLNLSRRGLFR